MTACRPERNKEKGARGFCRQRLSELTLAVALLLPLPAVAHQLVVFASVKDDVVLITAKFPDGTAVKAGTLRILDATDTVIIEQELDGTMPIVFPIDEHTDGLVIEVDAGNGHSNYWVLTPADLQRIPRN